MGSLTSVVALSKQSQVSNPNHNPKSQSYVMSRSSYPSAHGHTPSYRSAASTVYPSALGSDISETVASGSKILPHHFPPSDWQLLLRAEQPLCFVRPGPGHQPPRQLLALHLDEVASQHDHPLGLLFFLFQDREVLQLQCQLYQWGPATQGKPPRLDLQEHSGWRLWDPSHQLCPHNIIVRQRPSLQERRLQLLIQHINHGTMFIGT